MVQSTALLRTTPSRSGLKPRSAKTASNGRAGRRCAYCGKRLPANSKAIYCSASHRVSMSRHKRRSCGRLLEAVFTMPGPIAAGLLDRFGLPEVEAKLNALGWYWHAPDRAWERENAQLYREAA